MKSELLKFAAATGLTAAGVIGTGATTVVDAAGTVIAGTQIAEPHICTNGPVIDGLLFTASHCVSGNGWIQDPTDVAFKPAPGFDDSIYTPSGTIAVRGHIPPAVGMTVFKSGRTSGLSSGVVYNVSGGMWDAQGMQQCSGDSGAPVFTLIDGEAYIVGIATNGDGSVDEAGGVNHDKRCHNTSRRWDEYSAGGPTIDTMLAVAGSRASALPAPTQPPTTAPPAPPTPEAPAPTTEPPPPPTTEPAPPPTTEPARVPECHGLPATIVGTEGPDRIDGTGGDDVIVALGGNDTVYGRGGNDVICGGPGDDLLHGQTGADLLDGGRGNDQLLGGHGDDIAHGGHGDDTIRGHRGDDQLTGGNGHDHLHGDAGDDDLDGGQGSDDIFAEVGNDTISGGTAEDNVRRLRPGTVCRFVAVVNCRR